MSEPKIDIDSNIIKLQEEFNIKFNNLIDKVNKNEEELVKSWNATKITFELLLQSWSDNLDLKLKELESAQPKFIPLDSKKLVIDILSNSIPERQVTLNLQHPKFEDLIIDLKHGHNIYNYGPTGSGKTVAVYNAAKVLGMNVYRTVLNRETSPYRFSGHMSQGIYVEGLAFKPYTQGGILFADEIDNGNANAVTTLKEYADGDETWFPDGNLYPKHKDFRLVANANTVGNGANQTYIGRNQLDKALLNIFKNHYWDYDEEFEYSICWSEYLICGGKPESKLNFDRFLKSLRDMRRAIDDLGLLHIISPRNLKQASKDFAYGRDSGHILETIILKSLTDEQVTKVIEKVKSYYPGRSNANKLANLYEV